tara:strand:+ start:1294 stop:1548 length:255 start_codon:yes stop_codon:yes gene_type:complete
MNALLYGNVFICEGPAASIYTSTLSASGKYHMKRYKVKKGNEGNYCILDTSTNLVISWIAVKAAADRACKHINEQYQVSLAKTA